MRFALSRLAIAAIIAVIATFAVFLLMQSLISSGKSVVAEDNVGRLVEFVDMTKQDDLQTKQRKPKKPPVAPTTPPKVDAPKPDLNNLSTTNDAGSFVAGDLDINPQMDVDSGLAGSSSSDGEYLPIVKIAPQYPRSAAQRGIEGYVVLEFTVTALGTVTDVKVIEAEPATIFNQAAIAAAKKFKYKPQISNGKAQEVKGVRNIIRFELEKKSAR